MTTSLNFTITSRRLVRALVHPIRGYKSTALKINRAAFIENLRKTQMHCDERMSDKTLDNASVFRSFNPELNGRNLFEFQSATFDNIARPNTKSYNLAEWTTDPLAQNMIEDLFNEQLANIDNYTYNPRLGQSYKGDILISKIDLTLLDGASEFQSQGYFDTYDMPPIDTWFYMTRNSTSRLIFAWVPQQYKPRVNQAILVNCIDCIGWFSQWYPFESRITLSDI